MNKQLRLLITALTLIISSQSNAQQAEIQFIHNSADPALMLIDIYVNDTLVADDIVFRSATPMMVLPADSLLNIGIALNSSSSAADTIVSYQITMQDSGRYIALINGVLDSTQFAPNPDGASTALNILFQNNIAAVAGNSAKVDFIIAQGSTDLGIRDFVIRDDKKIADDITYNNVTSYDSVPAISFTLDITPDINDSIISSYQIDFTGMDGSSAVLVASGFRDPAANLNGPSFEFFAVFTNGSVYEYFPVSIAKLQAIHNCADPALDSIDIYTSGVLVVDNFHFRTATNIFNVPGDIPLEVAIAPGNSTSVNDTLRSFTLTFENGKNYVAIATGVTDSAAFAANPDGLNTSFNMILADGMKWKAQNATDVDFRFVNSVTDAPAVDFKHSWGPVINDNINYATLTQYSSLASPGTYNLNVTDSSDAYIYNSYQLTTDTLAGQSAVIFFSGFLNPAANQNGPAYDLFAAFADGKVLPFTLVTAVANDSHSQALSIYPNPATDYLHIKTLNSSAISYYRLLNVDGKVIRQGAYSGKEVQIGISTIPAGVYLAEVFCDGIVCREKVLIFR